jgi:hypothetical protein
MLPFDDFDREDSATGRPGEEALAGSSVLTPAAVPEGRDHVFHLFVVRSEARDELRAHQI